MLTHLCLTKELFVINNYNCKTVHHQTENEDFKTILLQCIFNRDTYIERDIY